MRPSTAAAFAVLVLLVVAGCGAAGPSAPASTAPSTAPSTGTLACHPTTDPVENPVTVTIADRTFDPDPVQAKVGQAIVWHNEDSVPHTATLDDIDCDTGQLGASADGTLMFTAAGTYAYHCRIHSSMHGTITIAP